MLDGKTVEGVLLMGGSGLRFHSDTPKQFHRLAGKPLFLYALETFLAASFFDGLVLVCHPDWIGHVESLLPKDLPCPIRVVPGGASRQESSRLGLEAFGSPPDVVVIHDAVRPFVSQRILLDNVRLATEFGAVDTCIPSADTLVHTRDGKIIAEIPRRSEFCRGQTPQSFSYPLIRKAHETTSQRNASDDCQLVLKLGHPVRIAAGDEMNVKITSELDLFLAEQILRLRLGEAPKAAPLSLNGKVFAVVGGTGGIGQAIRKRLQALQATAIPLSRTTAPAIDLRDPASIERAFQEIGELDGLINCAGILYAKPLQALSLSQIEEVLDVNLKGLILSCRAARIKEGGHVISIASSSFSCGRKDACIYSSAKAAVVNFAQGWAEERPDLRIHTLVPQRTRTKLREQNFPGEDPASLLDPEEVAEAAVSLLLQPTLTGLLVDIRKS